MAFSLKGKTMAEATQMLDNALDKSDTGEQIINGIIKIENDDGTPIDVQDENQVITRKYVDDKFDGRLGLYATINLSIPFNIDFDSEIQIVESDREKKTVYWAKCGYAKQINGIQLYTGGIYNIHYRSAKTITYTEYTIDLSDIEVRGETYNIELTPIAELAGSGEVARRSGANAYSVEGNMGLSGGLYNNYYYAIFLNSCDNIQLPDTNIDMFILSAGQNADNKPSTGYTGYEYRGYGGKRLSEVVYGDNNIANIIVGSTGWSDSKVIVGDVEYTTSGCEYSDKSDGVLPFNESAFVHLYGAGGSLSSVQYKTGGGYQTGTTDSCPGRFFGAGAAGGGSSNKGFQGIVIIRWRAD